ncbi:MAG: glutathione synthase, partial [Candidatus Azotimanducaceae bacterium]
GRSVFLLRANDPNCQVILETLTGNDNDEYCLLQPYVSEIEQGEKRVLIAGGVPVGQYLRRAAKDHRTNRMQGADIAACDLTAEEQQYCETIGEFLRSQGVEFAGLDLAYPWVIEFNVINPGGLLTIEQLTGAQLCKAIIKQII